jgi:hypothetical protein
MAAATAFAASTLAVIAMVAQPPAAPAPDSVLASFYGNTLVTIDDGIVAHFYYNADHTFTGTVPKFYFALKGTWYVNDKGEVCRVFDPAPPTIENPDCGRLLVHDLGEKNVDADGHGEKLVAGIQ